MLNQRDIIDIVSEKTGLSCEDSRVLFYSIFDSIKDGISEEEPFKLRGFGTFKLKRVAEKTQINLQTGEPIVVPEHNALAFKPQFEVEPKPRGILLENDFVADETEEIESEIDDEADESEEIEEDEEIQVQEEPVVNVKQQPAPVETKTVIEKVVAPANEDYDLLKSLVKDILRRVEVLEDDKVYLIHENDKLKERIAELTNRVHNLELNNCCCGQAKAEDNFKKEEVESPKQEEAEANVEEDNTIETRDSLAQKLDVDEEVATELLKFAGDSKNFEVSEDDQTITIKTKNKKED